MLAVTAAPRAFVAKPTVAPARRSVVQVAASSRPAAEEFVCPALECANKYAKTECVHPGRPVAQACKDCPRKGKRAAMAKSKCIHPQRPLSQACADCPRRKK